MKVVVVVGFLLIVGILFLSLGLLRFGFIVMYMFILFVGLFMIIVLIYIMFS